jgi:hypothetical protein
VGVGLAPIPYHTGTDPYHTDTHPQILPWHITCISHGVRTILEPTHLSVRILYTGNPLPMRAPAIVLTNCKDTRHRKLLILRLMCQDI